ncbi:hypothetical protein BDN71DRAFT_1431469 [Pleurotus eryngii]|uniref:Uncharacterized protein n=1 Tax=Pleurotus eryngii TaxID=5323 RepID=A0A9P6D847_PLEER|nr:hypothetical protein BDN71DRAFT_1431469 [Pleurotus eryngii]
MIIPSLGICSTCLANSRGDKISQVVKAIQKRPTISCRCDLDSIPRLNSDRRFASLLVDQEYETAKIRKGLIALERLRLEATRADEAERSRADMVANVRTLNESRVKALKEVEKEKEDAERSAARSRRIVRELNQNRLITEAKEEGRRLGFPAGLRRAQTELGAAEEADSNIDDAILAMELREGQGEEQYFHDDHNQDVDQELSPPPPEPVPIAQPVPQFSPRAAPPLLSSHSPAVEPYSLPIPSADQLNGLRNSRISCSMIHNHSIPTATIHGAIPSAQPPLLRGFRSWIYSKRRPIEIEGRFDLVMNENGNSSRAGTPSHQRSKSAMSQNSFRSRGNVAMDPNLSPLAEQGRSQPPLDPNPIYDDGRYTGRGDARDWGQMPPQSGRPPRHYPRPANLTVPAPLSAGGGVPGPSRHNRSFSDASSSCYENANSSGRREHGRMMSSHSLASSLGKSIAGIISALGMSRKESHPESEEITINVDPPPLGSNKVCYLVWPVERANHFQPSPQDTNSYLSPQNAPGPLPMPRSNFSSYGVRPSSPLIPTVPNTPTQPPLQWPNQDPRQGGRTPARVVPQGPQFVAIPIASVSSGSFPR